MGLCYSLFKRRVPKSANSSGTDILVEQTTTAQKSNGVNAKVNKAVRANGFASTPSITPKAGTRPTTRSAIEHNDPDDEANSSRTNIGLEQGATSQVSDGVETEITQPARGNSHASAPAVLNDANSEVTRSRLMTAHKEPNVMITQDNNFYSSCEFKELGEDLYALFQERERNGDNDFPVILPEEVKQIWKPVFYSKFYRNQPWYDPAWDKTLDMERYLIVMSILIYIDFNEWHRFREIFINLGHQLSSNGSFMGGRQDSYLPFDEEALCNSDFLGRKCGAMFYKHQFMFCPFVIQERAAPYKINQWNRPAFVGRPEHVDEGACGVVTKRIIAAGYLEFENRTVNDKASCTVRYLIVCANRKCSPGQLQSRV